MSMTRLARAIPLALILLAGALCTRPAAAAPAPCAPFSVFPLSITFGSGLNTGTGETVNCFAGKVQAALNSRGQPGGLASLGSDGLVPIAQIPATVALNTAILGAFRVSDTTTPKPTLGYGSVAVQNSSTTAEQIFGPQYPGVGCSTGAATCPYFTVDGVRSAMVIPYGATATNTQGFSAYIANQTPQYNNNGIESGNGVAYFGTITCQVAGSACWHINTTSVDDAANGSPLPADASPRKLIGYEADFSVRHPSSFVQGIVVTGSSSTQPAAADGFSCGPLGGPALWTHCFVVNEGTSLTGLYLGALGKSGPNRQSTPITLNWYDGTATGHLIDVFAAFGGVYARPSQGGSGVVLGTTTDGSAPYLASNSSTATDLDLELRAQGAGRIVARARIIGTAGLNPGGATYATLPPNLGPNDAGIQYWCVNCREPGQPTGQGSGVLVTWNGASWRSSAGGATAN